MTCSFCVSLLFNLSIKLLSELMILSSALMNSRFAVDFGLRKREKFQFSIFDLRHSHLWSYWVEWELVLIVWLCSITCQSIWYIICFDKSLLSMYCFNVFLLLCFSVLASIDAKRRDVIKAKKIIASKWRQKLLNLWTSEKNFSLYLIKREVMIKMHAVIARVESKDLTKVMMK